MSSRRPPIPGRDGAGAGALLLSVDLTCIGVGALLDGVTRLMPAGFSIGFCLRVYVVSRRSYDL